MLYNLNSLTTVEQCDAVLADANEEKSELMFDKNDAESRVTSDSNAATTIPGRLAELDARFAAKEAQQAALSDQSERDALQIELNNLENRRIRLGKRAVALQGVNISKHQLAIGLMEHEINGLNEFIAAVETRRTELVA